MTRRAIIQALTILTAVTGLTSLAGPVAASTPPRLEMEIQAEVGHGVLANLPGVISVASYQDNSGLYVVHAATRDGKIHEYTWR